MNNHNGILIDIDVVRNKRELIAKVGVDTELSGMFEVKLFGLECVMVIELE